MVVETVYKKFIENDGQDQWTEIDDYMVVLDSLSSDEIHREADELLRIHRDKAPFCHLENDSNYDLGYAVLNSIDAILEKHNASGKITPKEIYVLKYYLVLSHVGLISS